MTSKICRDSVVTGSLPVATDSFSFAVPQDERFQRVFMAQLAMMTREDFWEDSATATATQYQQLASAMLTTLTIS